MQDCLFFVVVVVLFFWFGQKEIQRTFKMKTFSHVFHCKFRENVQSMFQNDVFSNTNQKVTITVILLYIIFIYCTFDTSSDLFSVHLKSEFHKLLFSVAWMFAVNPPELCRAAFSPEWFPMLLKKTCTVPARMLDVIARTFFFLLCVIFYILLLDHDVTYAAGG